MGWVYAVRNLRTDEIYIDATRAPGSNVKDFVTRLLKQKAAPDIPQTWHNEAPLELEITPLKEFPNDELERRVEEARARIAPKPLRAPRKPIISKPGLRARIRRGLTGDALYTPAWANKKRYLVDGELLNVPEIAVMYNLSENTIRSRIHRGRTDQDLVRPQSRAGRPPKSPKESA